MIYHEAGSWSFILIQKTNCMARSIFQKLRELFAYNAARHTDHFYMYILYWVSKIFLWVLKTSWQT